MIEGKKVPAGEYGIYTVPRKAEWTVVLNKSLKQGADVDGFKDDQDVARFTIKPYKLASKVETFTISFTDLTPGHRQRGNGVGKHRRQIQNHGRCGQQGDGPD